MALSTLQAGRCFVIGEVGLAHDGSLGYAHAFIDEVARAGADAVKFQTHIAEACLHRFLKPFVGGDNLFVQILCNQLCRVHVRLLAQWNHVGQ